MSATLEARLGWATPPVARILDAVLSGHMLTVDQAEVLCRTVGPDLHALCRTADHLRAMQAGDDVGYVINRNINFTNLCVKSCKFCAFSRTVRSGEGYYLDRDEVVRLAQQAQAYGATEVCVQAGLPPNPEPDMYVKLITALRCALPEMHIHAMSPEEVRYGAQLKDMPLAEFLRELKAAGLSSLPGTSAEVLDDSVRKRLAGGRISTSQWIEVVTAAHQIGLPTTATLMYGHVESDRQRVEHLALLRSIQGDTGGFTEFVPLSFVHAEAPLHFKQMLPLVRPGPTGNEILRLYAIARLMLGQNFINIQTSWVKEGLRGAQWALACGANDLGGTLINESISTSAGAAHGQLITPPELRRVIRDAGRTPVQRDTLYRTLRRFGADPADDPREPLSEVRDPEVVFGTYRQLVERARRRKLS